MTTLSNVNIFGIITTGPLWVESIGDVDSPQKGQWRGALMFSLICVWTNGWTNNRDAGDLRPHRTHYDVIIMEQASLWWCRTAFVYISLLWRRNRRGSVSNHQPHDCLLNRLFRCRSKITSKLRVTGLCVGNSPGTGEFPAQRASNAENVSIWWRHHMMTCMWPMNCGSSSIW